MNSWDLFRTLCHARNSNAGEAPIHEHYPIAENIAKVQPDDIVVSEYYDPEKATRIVRDICGLGNQVIVTENGKTDGSVWLSLREKPTHHTGDNLHCDVLGPRKHGIQTTQVTQHEYTPTEREFVNQGNATLANVIREARLTTWHDDPKLRALQLHQIERNFPFLHAAAVKLNALMLEKSYTRLLLCSRDCYLLYQLMVRMFPNADYQIEYFHTSRLARYRPSSSYAEYARERLSGRTLIVDMNGTGRSLKHMCDKFGGDPLLVAGTQNTVPCLVAGGLRETSNLAPHPMVSDVVHDPDYVWTPVYTNPTQQDWQKPEIIAMQDALLIAADCLQHYENVQPISIERVLSRMESPALEPLWAGHFADSKAAYDLLNSGPLPHEVIL